VVTLGPTAQATLVYGCIVKVIFQELQILIRLFKIIHSSNDVKL
jgi:hypothetical protein